jgi:hypothetical protein
MCYIVIVGCYNIVIYATHHGCLKGVEGHADLGENLLECARCMMVSTKCWAAELNG